MRIGYRVGGKTGTAEKVVNGRYCQEQAADLLHRRLPDGRAAICRCMVMLDEPQATPETYGFATSGWNAVPTAGKIIARIAPLLGIEPMLTDEERKKLAKQAAALQESELTDERARLSRLSGRRCGACRAGARRCGDHRAHRRQPRGEARLSVRGTARQRKSMAPNSFRRRSPQVRRPSSRGAVGAGTERAASLIQRDNPRQLFALMAARFAGDQPDIVVAVTGTNGKTSVAAFVRQIWAVDGLSRRQHRHGRHRRAGRRGVSRAYDARSGQAARDAGEACRTIT